MIGRMSSDRAPAENAPAAPAPAPTRGRPLRVVVDTSPLTDARRTAGIGRYVDRLTAALEERADLEVHRAAPPWPAGRESWRWRYLRAQPWLAASALRSRADLLHATGSEPAAGWPLGRQVVTVHDVIPWTRPATSPRHRLVEAPLLRLQALRLRRVGAVVAVSATVADEVAVTLGVGRERIHVVSEGVAPAFSPAWREDDPAVCAAAGVSGPFVLWVGSLRAHDPRKALDLLVEALAQAVTGLDEPPVLVLAGAPGPEAGRVAARAAAAGVRVRLPGFVDDPTLAALQRRSLVSVVPSLHEGFGLCALEAMASGAPLVVSDAGNLPELAGDAALVVPAGDAPALGAALRRLIDDPSLGRALGARGVARSRAHTWAEAARRTAAVYAAVARR